MTNSIFIIQLMIKYYIKTKQNVSLLKGERLFFREVY